MGSCTGTLPDVSRVFRRLPRHIWTTLRPSDDLLGPSDDLVGALLQRADLALPVADSDTLTLTYRDFGHLVSDLRNSGETNALDARLRSATPRTVLARAAALYTDTFATPDGRLPATIEWITLTGWAPGPGQPRPLRPGSATERLAQALNTTETPLPD